jgi:flagellar biogenesis protein FliO
LVRTAFSLAAVLGLVVGLAWCYRKATGTKTTFKSGVATVVGRAAVSPKHGVVLVKVGRRVLVCGEAAGQPLTKLDVITDADEIAELVGTSATADRPFVSELADAGETYPEPADADVPPTEPQPQDAASELRTLISRIGQTTGVAKT